MISGATPDYEQRLESLYSSFLRSGDVAIDVGAHTGRHTLPISRATAPGGKVFAFEPLPGARARLCEIVRDLRETVSVYPYALADREGSDEFVVAVDLPAYSGLRIQTYDGPTRLERIPVEVRTLDRLFEEVARVDYIKIDAEGGELAILRGARDLLRRCTPIVTFEFGANSLAGYGVRVEDMAEFWAGQPYGMFYILGRRLDARALTESAVRQQVWDYVAVPIARVADILAKWSDRAS